MFTFGIFTTHIPYIAMVAFYAYFLLFGVNQAADGKIKIAEKSPTVQIHTNNSVEKAPADTYSFYASLNGYSGTVIIEKAKEKKKWKHFGVDKIFLEDQLKSILFGRPPPVLA